MTYYLHGFIDIIPYPDFSIPSGDYLLHIIQMIDTCDRPCIGPSILIHITVNQQTIAFNMSLHPSSSFSKTSPPAVDLNSTSNSQNENEVEVGNLTKYLNHRSFIFSSIDDIDQKLSPEQLRVKNNILLILLVLSAYGIYFLIGNFIDYLIIGYVAGLAYHQTRSKFTRFVMDPRSYEGRSSPLYIRIIKVILLIGSAFILPRVRFMLSNPHEFKNALNWVHYLKSFEKNTNMTVIVCQVFIVLVAIYVLLAPHLKKIGRRIRPTNTTCIQFTFGVIVLLVTISSVALIPTVFFKQIGEVGYFAEQKVEQFLECQIITFGSHNNASRSLCSDKVTENYFVKQTIEEFKNQNQTVQHCKKHVSQFQTDYIGSQVFHYDEIACTWYSIIAKAYNYSAIQSQTQQLSTASIFSTGTSIFKNIFGNLTSILSTFSNTIFYFTIWLTTFLLTTRLPNRYLTFKHIFSENKQQLIGDITKLIHATCLIVIWHFVVSLILLELFEFTPVNLIVSIFLALMAFVPVFRPWFGVLGVGLIRMVVLKQYVVTLLFVAVYLYISEKIYSFYYGKLKMHEIVVNYSVLFGIYSFGITGIFYGPLIVILFSCVEKELLSNYKQILPELQQKRSSDSRGDPEDKEIDYLRKRESQYHNQMKEEDEERLREDGEPAIKIRYLTKQAVDPQPSQWQTSKQQ